MVDDNNPDDSGIDFEGYDYAVVEHNGDVYDLFNDITEAEQCADALFEEDYRRARVVQNPNMNDDEADEDEYILFREPSPPAETMFTFAQEAREPENIRRWGLGDHDSNPDSDWEYLDSELEHISDSAPGLADALREAREMARKFNVHGFECPVCGLNHSHPDTKHDIRSEVSGFSVKEEVAEAMDMCPFCHCGVNELARLMNHFGRIHRPVFEDEDELFPDVRSLAPEVINGVLDMYTAGTEQMKQRQEEGLAGWDEEYTFADAITDSGHGDRVRDLSVADPDVPAMAVQFSRFHDRAESIKKAANHAPIPDETSNILDQRLGNY